MDARLYSGRMQRSAGIIASACGDTPMPAEALKPRVDWLDDERRKDKAAARPPGRETGGGRGRARRRRPNRPRNSARRWRASTPSSSPGRSRSCCAHHREDLQRTMESLKKRRLEAEEKSAKVRVAEREVRLNARWAICTANWRALTELQRTVEIAPRGAGAARAPLCRRRARRSTASSAATRNACA